MKLTNKYLWQKGDTLTSIAIKYRRGSQWRELLDHNIILIRESNYLLREGDVIEIPDSWFPLPDYSFETEIKGSSGYRRVG